LKVNEFNIASINIANEEKELASKSNVREEVILADCFNLVFTVRG